MTIALYIFYQRNRLPGPSRNPHIHFLLPRTHPATHVHRWSIYQGGISATAITFMALPPRQKTQQDPKQGLDPNPNLSCHQCCCTASKQKSWMQNTALRIRQHLSFSPSTSLSGLSTHRVAATCYPLHRSFSNGFYNTVLKEKQGRECVIIIKAEGRGRIGGDFALYISRFRTAQKLEYLFDVQYFYH